MSCDSMTWCQMDVHSIMQESGALRGSGSAADFCVHHEPDAAQ